MRFAFALVCSQLVCGQAMADGVLLATPAPSLSVTDPVMIEINKHPAVVGVTAVHLNRNAMNSNIIRLNIEGKERSFIGGPSPNLNGIACWSGKEPGDPHKGMLRLMSLCKDPVTGELDGAISTETRTYEIFMRKGHELIVEKDRNHNVPMIGVPPSKEKQ